MCKCNSLAIPLLIDSSRKLTHIAGHIHGCWIVCDGKELEMTHILDWITNMEWIGLK